MPSIPKNYGNYLSGGKLSPYSFTGGVGVKLEGDWNKLLNITNNQRLVLLAAYKKGQKAAATAFWKEIRKQMRTGGWSLGITADPINPESKYPDWKARHGGNWDKSFILSKTYYNSIEVIENDNSSKPRISVGVRKGIRRPQIGNNKPGDLTVSDYANIVELGSEIRKIKARPLWRLTFKHFGGKNRIRGFLRIYIYAAYRSLGLQINKI